MKRYLLYLLIMVTSVLSVRLMIYGNSLKEKWQYENYWLTKANLDQKFDLLVLGDSRIFTGVDPDVLKHRPLDESQNFAFASISYTPHYLQKANELLQPNATVFLGLTLESLTLFEAAKSLENYEKIGPLIYHRTLKWLRVYWPELSLNLFLRRGVVLPKSENEKKNIYHDNGWVETMAGITNEPGGMIRAYEDIFLKNKVDEQLVSGLIQQIQEWTASGKKVFIFWTCFEKDVCAIENHYYPPELRLILLKRLEGAGARVLTIKDQYRTFDGDHLNSGEAKRFSQELKKLSEMPLGH